MFFYVHIALFLFLFLGCGGDISSTKGFKKSSNTNGSSDLEKLKNEAKIRSIIINRNVSKDFLKTEPLKYELSVSYKVPFSVTCKDLREYSTFVTGSGKFYKKYASPNIPATCIDINHVNTDNSGDYKLIIAHGKNTLDSNSSDLLGVNTSKGPKFWHVFTSVKHMNDYYKNPKSLNDSTIAITTKIIESIFNLEKIKSESTTKDISIWRSVTPRDKSEVSSPTATFYDISWDNITCKKISKDYMFLEKSYKNSLVNSPNTILKPYHLKEHNVWCTELDLTNSSESGSESFLLTETPKRPIM